MKRRETLIQVGCFGLVALGVLAAGTLALLKFWKPRLYYPVLYKDVSVTVGPGSLVLLHGEQIGEVVSREFWEQDGQANVLITVAIEPKWRPQIRRNLLATIEENFVTGVQNINLRIRPPSVQAGAGGFLEPTAFPSLEDAILNSWQIEPFAEGRRVGDVDRENLVAYIEGEPSPFERLRSQANDLQDTMTSIRGAASSIQDLIQITVKDEVRTLNATIERLSGSFDKAALRVDSAGAGFEKVCDRIVATMDESKGDFQSVARSLNATLAEDGELRKLLRTADATFVKLGELLGKEGELVTLTRTVQDTFKKVSDNLSPDGEFFKLTHAASDTLRSVGEVAGDLHVVLASQEADLSDSLAQFKSSVQSLRQFSEELERDPSSLVLGARKPAGAKEAFEFPRRSER